MKSNMSQLIAILATCAVAATAAQAQTGTDLTLRRALYFTGKKFDSIDLKNDKYVAENKFITLHKTDAFKTEGEYLYFYFGYIAFREPGGPQFQTHVQYKLEKSSIGVETVFLNNSKTRQGVLPLKLRKGRNVITAVIDPFQKTAETNEANNSFHVTIMVE